MGEGHETGIDSDINGNITVEEFSHLKGFKIMHLNARSLFSKLDIIKHSFIPYTNILCFTETWFKPELVSNLTEIKGYQLIRNDRSKRRGGGTCIFLREEIKYDIVDPISDVHIEMQVVTIKGINAKNIILVNCYRPPDGNAELAVNTIKSCLNQINNLDRCEVVILGDLNLDYSETTLDSHKLLASIEEEFTCPYKNMCPYKKTKISVNRPEWMNRELLEYEIHRDTLFRIYNRSKTQNNYDKASYARKVYNTMLKEAKQKYMFMLGKLKEHEKDKKKFGKRLKC